MLYHCERYDPLNSLELYEPEKDVSVTRNYFLITMKQLKGR